MDDVLEGRGKIRDPRFKKRRITLHRGDLFRRHPAEKQGLLPFSPFQDPVQFIKGLSFRTFQLGQIGDPKILMLCPLMDKKILYRPQRSNDPDGHPHLLTDLSDKSFGRALPEMNPSSGQNPEIISLKSMNEDLLPSLNKSRCPQIEGPVVFDK
jgi:hypothetical protein